ncbi:WD40-repeat-containing domain protein [Fimicolochytrium jonesii]|uniref:WD40-repeat-containing domain protein n=1 Tax=Fimicolochytrium jonesii TaxID=1396493 RepID=UPI0022FF3EAE|nr:WD40-repeat-containing domain protein [Fimicolochytrium jonesii]KAI8818239.1 WD40-repeat-containing domain protein [Fimicolochytrium jonesii]
MKLKIHQEQTNRHFDIVTSVNWTGNNELFSIGDDRQVLRWSGDGDFVGQQSLAVFDGQTSGQEVHASEIHWVPAAPGKGGQTTAESFALAGTDGKFYFCSKNGRVEKVVEAHTGAILSLRWNYEGSALVTVGEDGHAKIWSRGGMLRSAIIQTSYPIYSVAWSPDNDQLLLTNGRNLIIKSLQAGSKPQQWKAHEGVILKVDWSLVNGLILSAGEDRKYKVWDAFGRQLYSSSAHDHPITSIAWNPSGEMFAVGSYNMIRVCDKLGWSYAMEKPESGSIFGIAWTPDGTQMACAGGSGAVVFGHVINRRFEWKNYEATILDDHRLLVHDVVQGTSENLEFRDRVVKAVLGYGHLIVATSTQCHIYSERNWNTPAIIDLSSGGRVTCLQQCLQSFALIDTVTGIQIFSYEGRLISQPKYPGLRAECVTPQTLSISTDVLAIRDKADEKTVFLFETHSGRPLGQGSVKHHVDIAEIGLNQSSSAGTRQLVLVDRNRDMFITTVVRADFKKLGTMIESFAWNSEADLLVAMMDYKFVVWFYPNVVFVDEDIAPLTKFEKDGSAFGKDAQIVSFHGTQCTLRRADGTLVTVSNITPLPAVLQEHVRKKQWEEALRLCRYANTKELWSCLAAMAVNGQDLNTAEVAYAAIDEVSKVRYIVYIRDIPTAEGRAAELALLRRRPTEAENILLSANMTYRAIKMWIALFDWERALELAVKYKTHVDTVLYFREKYLKAVRRRETNRKFVKYSQNVQVNEEKIKAKMLMEEESERNRTSAR